MQFLSATVGFVLASIITLGATAPPAAAFAQAGHSIAIALER